MKKNRRNEREITNCSRCGRSHRSVRIKRLTRPIEHKGDTIATHWGMCPRTNDPILVVMSE